MKDLLLKRHTRQPSEFKRRAASLYSPLGLDETRREAERALREMGIAVITDSPQRLSCSAVWWASAPRHRACPKCSRRVSTCSLLNDHLNVVVLDDAGAVVYTSEVAEP
jgi:hypothetical protein